MHVTFLVEENASPSGGSAVGASKQMSANESEAHVQCALVQSVRLGSVCACFFSLCIALFATGCAGGSSVPPAPPPPLPVSVSLSSTTASVQAGIGTQKFTPTVQNDPPSQGGNWAPTQSGANCSPGWRTHSATSSVSGVPIRYTGPSSVPANPSVTLTATSVTDAARSAAANITVTVNPGNTAVTVSPKRAAITKWQTQTFTATVTGSNNAAVIWQVDTIPNGNATVGTIDSNGKYTPPASAGAHMITVVSNADVSKSAAASIGV